MQTNGPEQEGVPIHPGSIASSSQMPKRSSPGTSPASAHIDIPGEPPWPHGEGLALEATSSTLLREGPPSLRLPGQGSLAGQGSVPENYPVTPRGSIITPRSSILQDEKSPGGASPNSKERRTTDSGDHLNAVLLGHTHSQIRLRWPAGRSPRNLLVRVFKLSFCCVVAYLGTEITLTPSPLTCFYFRYKSVSVIESVLAYKFVIV